MNTYDWSRFMVRINVNATIAKLYNCWATKAGMESWFLRLCEYKSQTGDVLKNDQPVQKGDTYRWLWHGWPDDVAEQGEILESNGKDFIKFKFGNAGDCAVKIYEEQGEKIVELVQENIPTDEKSKTGWHMGCKTGWTFFLTNLKSVMEGGIDLRNKNDQLKNVVNS